MITVSCEMQFALASASDHGSIADHVDDVMRELIALEDVNNALSDSAVGLDVGSMTVTIGIAASSETFDEATSQATSAIRAAIHAAGGATPNWDGLAEPGQDTPFEALMQDLRVVPLPG